jgi:hypothetical protein
MAHLLSGYCVAATAVVESNCGTGAGPQREVRRGHEMRSDVRSRTASRPEGRFVRDNRTAPARDDLAEQARQDSNPDRRGWSSPCSRLHHGPRGSADVQVDRHLRAFASAHRSLRQVRQVVRPAGVEPAPRPYKGRVLAVDTTEAKWRRRESNPLLLDASEALCHKSFIPEVRTGGVEPPQRAAAGLQPAELTGAQRPLGG